MVAYRNLGVKIDENFSVQQLVAEVETALPAFVGYTAKACRKIENDLRLVPTKIGSMREFENLFGFPCESEIDIHVTTDCSSRYVISALHESDLMYFLHYSVRLYFENGGGSCYILSVDTYQNPPQISLKHDGVSGSFGLLDGLLELSEVAEVSLVVIPEAVKLPKAEYSQLVQTELAQCHTLGNRFAIFDLYEGDSNLPDINHNKDLFGSKYLSCGSAYYPFIKTPINSYSEPDGSKVRVSYSGEIATLSHIKRTNLHLHKFILTELKKRCIILPSSGAVAGTYVATDQKRGVWKSPTNLCLAGVSEPAVHFGNQTHGDYPQESVPGRCINTIRTYSGRGKKAVVWGARTLADNDQEGQFISVCRFLIMLKESLRNSTCWTAFEPNDAGTWIRVRRMIENYLMVKWQEGALAGIIHQHAFYVRCDLGSTMNAVDVLEGNLNIEIGVALLRPSEFEIIRISHQLRKSAANLTIL